VCVQRLGCWGCDPAVAGLYKLPAKKSPRAKRRRRRANWQVSAADYDGLIWREERLGACTAREAVVAHTCAETCNVHWLSLMLLLLRAARVRVEPIVMLNQSAEKCSSCNTL
jgi:hypothetical protein